MSRTVETKGGALIHEHRLRNGLRVLIAERHHDPVVAVTLWYGVGSVDEPEELAGVSHFLEHMMFKGSRRFAKGEVDLVTTVLGGNNNAFTTPDHTAYWFEFASDRWRKALEIEADRMEHLTLDPEEFEAEKAVVLEELSMGRDDPWRRLSDAVAEALFGRHPYRRPVIGYADTVERMERGTMLAFYRRHYHPANAVLVLAGDLRPGSALREVRARFGGIRAPADGSARSYRVPCQPPVGEHRLRLEWDDGSRRLCIAWPTTRVGTPEDDALDLIAGLLTAGRLSRLHRRLVIDEGLASNVSTSNDTRVEGGAFWLYAECADGVAPEELERALDEEFARLREELVRRRELERAKAILIATDAYESETASDLAEDLGEFAIDADWRLAVTGCDRLRAVTAGQVRDVARRLLGRERRVIGWSLPRGEREALARRAPRRRAARAAAHERGGKR